MTPSTTSPGSQDAAYRKGREEEARKALAVSRSRLLISRKPTFCFFGSLAMRLDPRADWSIDTAATDSRLLLYNPDFFLGLSDSHRQFIVAHEVLHVALLHFARMQERNPRRWNVAADLAINQTLADAGFDLPRPALMPGQKPFESMPKGKSAEEYYALLRDDPNGESCGRENEGEGGGVGGDGGNSEDPGGCGSVRPLSTSTGGGSGGDSTEPSSPTANGTTYSEDEQIAVWKSAVASAATEARSRGNLPASLDRWVREQLRPVVPWQDVLRAFINVYARNDYSWLRPNRRLLGSGLYLPGLRSEELGKVVCLVDTSGSIGAPQLDRFAAELQGILEAYDCSLVILYHDTQIAGEQRWEPGDGPLRLAAKGGGGTSHIAALAAAVEHEPTVVVAFTDLYSSFPGRVEYPLLWCVVNNPDPEAYAPGYGQLLPIPSPI